MNSGSFTQMDWKLRVSAARAREANPAVIFTTAADARPASEALLNALREMDITVAISPLAGTDAVIERRGKASWLNPVCTARVYSLASASGRAVGEII